jgi:HAD superfamily hydrolase (TIGR01484 family)
MRYFVLATDYDGTIAENGRVDEETVVALERVRSSGRRLVLVTGRQLDDDFLAVFPRTDLFDRVVAENGALLYRPDTRERVVLGEPPDARFVAELRARQVEPLSVGRSIVATWHPHETTVLEVVRELGLELQVVFNKGAVMVLPTGVNKASGLAAALADLGLSPHNAVGIGDAENDHAFLNLCEAAVAVANALPALKERADMVTGSDLGAGVRELIDLLVDDDLARLEPLLGRHHLTLGMAGGRHLGLSPYGVNLLLAGQSGSGKSTLATAILEDLRRHDYQHVVIDPEGDYEELDGAVVVGTAKRPPVVGEVLDVLAAPERHAVVNFLALPFEERPAFFQQLLPALIELRTRTGHPHWLLIDEAHHLLPVSWQPAPLALPQALTGLLLVTVHPGSVSPAVLREVDALVAVGAAPQAVVADFARSRGEAPPPLDGVELEAGREALFWRPGDEPVRFTMAAPRERSLRHRRKYAEGDLGDMSFHFRGPDERLNLRAQNLTLFLQIADGVDDETWEHHLRRGDYSAWMREAVKNDALVEDVERVERDRGLSAQESRSRVRAAVVAHYAPPA